MSDLELQKQKYQDYHANKNANEATDDQLLNTIALMKHGVQNTGTQINNHIIILDDINQKQVELIDKVEKQQSKLDKLVSGTPEWKVWCVIVAEILILVIF